MAIVGTNAGIYLDGYDLSGDFNSFSIISEVDAQDATTWLDSEVAEARIKEPGLIKSSVEFGGFWRSAAAGPDEILRDRLQVKDGVLLLATGDAGTDGDPCYLLSASQGRYSASPMSGGVIPYQGSMFGTANRPGLAGKLLSPLARRNAGSGTTTPVQVGAVTAGHNLHGILQVTNMLIASILAVTVQSDVDANFNSPTAVFSFTQVVDTVHAAEYKIPSPAVTTTDTWYRVSWTVTGFWVDFAVGVAII